MTGTAPLTGGQPRFAGRPVTLGGVVYTVAPLNVGRLKQLQESGTLARASAIQGLPTIEEWDVMLELFLAAFQRNNPEMTKATLEEVVDLGNFAEITRAIMAVSGLEKVAGEAGPGAE